MSARSLPYPRPGVNCRGSEYRSCVEQLRRKGSYFILPRAFFGSLKPQSALLLACLLNACQSNSDALGWLRCTDEFIERGCGLRGDVLGRAFEHLLERGLCEVETRGGDRHIRLDTSAVLRLVR